MRPRPTHGNGSIRSDGSKRSGGMTNLPMPSRRTESMQAAATVPASSPAKWTPANVRMRLAARLKLSEALNLVANMIDSFPGTETLDPDHYNGALAAALCQHPRE